MSCSFDYYILQNHIMTGVFIDMLVISKKLQYHTTIATDLQTFG